MLKYSGTGSLTGAVRIFRLNCYKFNTSFSAGSLDLANYVRHEILIFPALLFLEPDADNKQLFLVKRIQVEN